MYTRRKSQNVKTQPVKSLTQHPECLHTHCRCLHKIFPRYSFLLAPDVEILALSHDLRPLSQSPATVPGSIEITPNRFHRLDLPTSDRLLAVSARARMTCSPFFKNFLCIWRDLWPVYFSVSVRHILSIFDPLQRESERECLMRRRGGTRERLLTQGQPVLTRALWWSDFARSVVSGRRSKWTQHLQKAPSLLRSTLSWRLGTGHNVQDRRTSLIGCVLKALRQELIERGKCRWGECCSICTNYDKTAAWRWRARSRRWRTKTSHLCFSAQILIVSPTSVQARC